MNSNCDAFRAAFFERRPSLTQWQVDFISNLPDSSHVLSTGTATVERFKRKKVWQEDRPGVLVLTSVYRQKIIFTLNSDGKVDRHWVGEDNLIKWSEDYNE